MGCKLVIIKPLNVLLRLNFAVKCCNVSLQLSKNFNGIRTCFLALEHKMDKYGFEMKPEPQPSLSDLTFDVFFKSEFRTANELS